MMPKLRVLIAEDHYLVREGIRRTLQDDDDIDVISTVRTAIELETAAAEKSPDVIVTDIRMPPGNHMDGIDAALRIRSQTPDVGVVVLSQHSDAAYAMELLSGGTKGVAYLLKERVGNPLQLIGAVKQVAHGGSVIDPAVVSSLVEQNRRLSSSRLKELTDRELDVLSQMTQGMTNAAIADHLHLSVSSVEKYSTSIFLKLGLSDEPQTHRRVAAVLAYLHEQGRATPL
jgi:DNA-binding NarL/FixJ family response regulator